MTPVGPSGHREPFSKWGSRLVGASGMVLTLVGAAAALVVAWGGILGIANAVGLPTVGAFLSWLARQSVLWLFLPVLVWVAASVAARGRLRELRDLLSDMLVRLMPTDRVSPDVDLDDVIPTPPRRPEPPNA